MSVRGVLKNMSYVLLIAEGHNRLHAVWLIDELKRSKAMQRILIGDYCIALHRLSEAHPNQGECRRAKMPAPVRVSLSTEAREYWRSCFFL
jgi:hypothetical protein